MRESCNGAGVVRKEKQMENCDVKKTQKEKMNFFAF